MSNRKQVLDAIAKTGAPMTMPMIFTACDCFFDQKDCASLLNEMEKDELVSFRAQGETWKRYGLPRMSFAKQVLDPKQAPSPTPAALVTVATVRAPHSTASKIDTTPDGRPTTPYGNIAGKLAIQKVRDAFQGHDRLLTTVEISDLTDQSRPATNQTIAKMVKSQELVRFGNGSSTVYALAYSKAAMLRESAAEQQVRGALPKKENPEPRVEVAPNAAEIAAASLADDAPQFGRGAFAPLVDGRVLSPTFKLDMDHANRHQVHAIVPPSDEDNLVISKMLNCLTHAEFISYCKGNILESGIRGDMHRQKIFNQALAAL